MNTTRKNFLSLSLLSLSYLGVLSGCGGGGGDSTTDPPPPSVLTRKVQGYLTRVDNISAAFDNIRVAIKIVLSGGRAEGDTVKVVTPDSSGKYVVDVAPGDYTVEITSTDSATAPVQIPITVKQEIETTSVETAGLLPAGLTITRVEFILPAADGYNGTYKIGQTYTIKSKVVTSGGTFENWRPLWSVEGGMGNIGASGDFTPTNTGTGKLVANFGGGTTKVVFKTGDIKTSDGKIPAPTLYVSHSGTPHLVSLDSRTGALTGVTLPQVGTEYSSPLALGSDGTIYGGSGNFVYALRPGTAQFLPGDSLGYPVYLVLGLPGSRTFTVTSAAVHLLDVAGKKLTPAATLAESTYGNLSSVYGCTTDGAGNIYVLGSNGSYWKICQFKVTGDSLTFVKDIVANVFTTSNYAFRGIVLLPNGSLCLSEQKSNTLYSLATGGGALTAMKTVTSMEGSLAVGQNVINQGDNVLFVHANNKLFRFNINGLTLTDIDSPGVSFSSTTFGSVYGIFSKPPA